MQITPKPNNRVLVVGPTGSGKTRLLRWTFYRYARNGIVMDFKHDWNKAKQDLEAENLLQLQRAIDKRDHKKTHYVLAGEAEVRPHIVYRVPVEHKNPDNAKFLDRVPEIAMQHGDITLCYDELVYVANGNDFVKRAPNFYYAQTSGREPFHVGVWGGSQRFSWIPQTCSSESDIRATFFMRKEEDRDRAEELLGDDIPWNILRKHEYSFVIGTDKETSIPLKFEFGSTKPSQLNERNQNNAS